MAGRDRFQKIGPDLFNHGSFQRWKPTRFV
jgi:hypothetical protein